MFVKNLTKQFMKIVFYVFSNDRLITVITKIIEINIYDVMIYLFV